MHIFFQILGPVGGLVGGIMGSAAGYLNGDDYDGIIIEITNLENERRNVSDTSLLAFNMNSIL